MSVRIRTMKILHITSDTGLRYWEELERRVGDPPGSPSGNLEQPRS